MAKQPQQPAATKATAYPAGWGKFTPEQKAQWRQKNQGYTPPPKAVGAPKQYPATGAKPSPAATPMVRPMGTETQAHQGEGEGEGEGEQLGQEHQGEGEQLGQEGAGAGAGQAVMGEVLSQISPAAIRFIAANFLRAVADVLEAGTGAEETEE